MQVVYLPFLMQQYAPRYAIQGTLLQIVCPFIAITEHYQLHLEFVYRIHVINQQILPPLIIIIIVILQRFILSPVLPFAIMDIHLLDH